MRANKVILAVLTLLISFGAVQNSWAEISNAAVLFLRIAPGSRAAGMGEAFVAIADDATATHWNPAGLGNYPLSTSWIEAKVPDEYRPLTAIAPLSTGGDRRYLDYDVWAISAKGLVRYDNKRWSHEEVFSTRTDETVSDKVRAYFNVFNEERLAEMVTRVARANNETSVDDLKKLTDEILAAIPEEYDARERMVSDVDSLLICYDLCRVNWSRVHEAERRFRDGMKDSLLSETESDQISVALERSRNRFLPEDLKIPYGTLFGGEITALTSDGATLMIGSTDGLAWFNGSVWQTLTAGENLPSSNITFLATVGRSIVIGTDAGVAVYNGLSITRLGVDENSIPAGEIQAIGGTSLNDIYAVVNGDLFHYDGTSWTNTTMHTVAVGDSVERIAERYALYGSLMEKQAYLTKLNVLINNAKAAATTEVIPEGTADSTNEASPTGEYLTPGKSVAVPFCAEIKGRANDIHVDLSGRLWLATDYGIFYLEDGEWFAPGYGTHQVVEGETIETIATAPGHPSFGANDDPTAVLTAVNGLDEQPLQVGQTIRVRRNPAAFPTASISHDNQRIYFASEGGLLEFDGENWGRSSTHGLGRANVLRVATQQDETWIGTEDRVVVKARGRSEVVAMHVNWLPELADDLYYEFLSVVTEKEGLGTFGGSVTFISYGKFLRTGEDSPVIVGEFESFDLAGTLSYGTSLTTKLKGGVSAKFIYSRLTDQGAGVEQGSGTSTGFAIDLGLLYLLNNRMTFGMAVTNIGPKMAYIDAAQSDDLPRNLGIGFAYKLMQSEYNRLIITAEANKMLVGLNDQASQELQELIFNGGAEFTYANLISARAGYIFDEEGEVKTVTLGFGLNLFDRVEFDFAYIPSQSNFSLANTLRISARLML